jgi:hypothetical protein
MYLQYHPHENNPDTNPDLHGIVPDFLQFRKESRSRAEETTTKDGRVGSAEASV